MTVDFLLLSVGAAVFLRMLYAAAKVSWPMSYFEIGTGPLSGLDPLVSRTWPRYFLFRTLPVFAVVTFVVTTAGAWGRNPWLVGGTTAVLYIALSFLPTLASRQRRQEVGQRTIVFWVASAALVLLAAGTAVALRSHTSGLVPSSREVVVAVWVAAFVSVIALGAARQLSPRLDSGTALQRSRLELDPSLLDATRALCERYDASVELATAIMIYENLQRPKWFRRLERAVGEIGRLDGTYGIMQVRYPKPVNDLQSVELAVTRLVGTARKAGEHEAAYDKRLWDAVSAYNSNPHFISGVFHAMFLLTDG